jgi:hypothetical protein
LYYESRKNHTKKYYNIFRFLVTTGSILLPAILSMGQMDPAKLPKNFENVSYWTSWTISLMVTACNGFLQLFSLDKNYFEYSITTEQLKTEGWQFFQLSGKYEEYESHREAYKSFCKSIENIKRKQVEKEFPGKADINKGKKDKKFDFQTELIKNLPQQYAPQQVGQQLSQQLPQQQLSQQQVNANEKIDSIFNAVSENIPDIEIPDITPLDESVEGGKGGKGGKGEDLKDVSGGPKVQK